jgi:hypothetical protein
VEVRLLQLPLPATLKDVPVYLSWTYSPKLKLNLNAISSWYTKTSTGTRKIDNSYAAASTSPASVLIISPSAILKDLSLRHSRRIMANLSGSYHLGGIHTLVV